MTPMLALSDFTPHVGETYDVTLPDGATVALILRAARSLGASPLGGSERAPFALELESQSAGRLEQRTYPVRFPGGAVHEIFLVPVGVTSAGGMRMEAIFT